MVPIGSTEIMVFNPDTAGHIEMKWMIRSPLPYNYKLTGLRAVHYRDAIYAFGKIDLV